MNEYTREQLLNRLKELVNKSEFISNEIISYWEKLENIEDLKKLLVIIYNSFEKEKELTDKEKNQLTETLIDLNKQKIEAYKKYEKDLRFNAEESEKEKEDIEKILLNF
jgi:hypothetical protein